MRITKRGGSAPRKRPQCVSFRSRFFTYRSMTRGDGKNQSRTRAPTWAQERRKKKHRSLAGSMANTAQYRLLTPGDIGRGISTTSCKWLFENFRPVLSQIRKHLEISVIGIGFLHVSIHPHTGGVTDILWSF